MPKCLMIDIAETESWKKEKMLPRSVYHITTPPSLRCDLRSEPVFTEQWRCDKIRWQVSVFGTKPYVRRPLEVNGKEIAGV